jgi:FKBP-type peptidyl-prolyl cis-trans isomerase
VACQSGEKKAPAEGETATAAHDEHAGHDHAAPAAGTDAASGGQAASGMGDGAEGNENAAASSPAGAAASGAAASTPPASGGKVTTTASGLKYEDLVAGTGASPKAGQTCSVHYTGWLTNGNKFDSSRDRGQPFTFPIGQGAVIKGWDEGVMGMKVGGKRKLMVPPDLAYGAQGFPPVIPPNSELVFEVELLGVQ